MASSLHLQIKKATQSDHERLEQVTIARQLLSRQLTMQDYTSYLSALYGFIAPIEFHLRRIPILNSNDFNFSKRQKLPLLQRDLQIMEVSVEKIKVCPVQIDLNRLPQTLAYLYVIEGSTLGGQILLRHVSRALNLSAEHGASFLYGYGSDTGDMWHKFWEFTAQHIEADNKDEFIQTACQIFQTLEIWLSKGYCND